LRFADFLKDRKVISPDRGLIPSPKVSVIMPTYCRAHDGILERAIKSVLCQTFSDFEFIIVDDGSSDGTEDIVRDFQKQDNRIIYIRHELNSGLPALRVDEGILLSRGNYLAFQFDDDEWLPRFREVAIAEAEGKQKRFVHAQAEYWLGDKLFHPCFPAVAHPYQSLLQRNKIANASVVLHRSILEQNGLYNPHAVLRRSTDWELWLRLARVEPPHLIQEVFVRIHGGLPDSIAYKAPWLDHEDFCSLALLSSPARLSPGEITRFEVASLKQYQGKLHPETLARLYHNIIAPWLEEHRRHFASHDIPVSEIEREISRLPTAQARAPRPFISLERVISYIYKLVNILPLNVEGFADSLERVISYIYKLVPKYSTPIASLDSGGGAPLQPSPDLRRVPFLVYPLPVEEGRLHAIELQLATPQPAPSGVVGIEIVSGDNRIVSQTEFPVFAVANGRHFNATFYFEPPLSPGTYWARVYGKRLSSPVYVLDNGSTAFAEERIPYWRLHTV